MIHPVAMSKPNIICLPMGKKKKQKKTPAVLQKGSNPRYVWDQGMFEFGFDTCSAQVEQCTNCLETWC